MVPDMHDPASIYEYVRLSAWPGLVFLELKITKVVKSSGWGLERSELLWEHNFLLA